MYSILDWFFLMKIAGALVLIGEGEEGGWEEMGALQETANLRRVPPSLSPEI